MIKEAALNELKQVAELAVQMWNKHSVQALKDEFETLVLTGNVKFFLKYLQDVPVGFAQCQIRHEYVEGAKSGMVGYLEGIFIKKEYRRKGYGRELLAACEQWAKQQGCTEFASDCDADNVSSYKFHMKTDFIEANRIICFVKEL